MKCPSCQAEFSTVAGLGLCECECVSITTDEACGGPRMVTQSDRCRIRELENLVAEFHEAGSQKLVDRTQNEFDDALDRFEQACDALLSEAAKIKERT